MECTGFEPCNGTLFWCHFGCVCLMYAGDWPTKACIERSMLISESVYHQFVCYKTCSVTVLQLQSVAIQYINNEKCDLIKPSEKIFTEFEFH